MTFYFYDVETSSLNPREGRIMQFAGQRTNMDLKPVGKPHNFLIKMTPDIVPDPFAVLVTGITPQKTLADGITEAEFLEIFYKEIATPGTIFVGYNTVRFDDEFMRYQQFRNFYDPYEWQWKDDRSRWDMLDAVRMTRALRPEGINWPKDDKGAPTNRLELLTALNDLAHENKHDALGDVKAVISVAQLIKKSQPKLFDFLFKMRDKKEVAKLVMSNQPFIYTSGRYSSDYEKTTIASVLAEHPRRQGALVYDLRYDPEEFIDLSPKELLQAWQYQKDKSGPRLPVKTLLYNRCPAVAPLSVLDDASQKRLDLTIALAKDNYKKLQKQKEFTNNVLKALELLDKKQDERLAKEDKPVDSKLYEGFLDNEDRRAIQAVHMSTPEELSKIAQSFKDKRLKDLLPLYKARNFYEFLNDDEHKDWEKYRSERLLFGGENSRLANYFNKISELQARPELSDNQQYLLEEMRLYGESIMPDTDWS